MGVVMMVLVSGRLLGTSCKYGENALCPNPPCYAYYTDACTNETMVTHLGHGIWACSNKTCTVDGIVDSCAGELDNQAIKCTYLRCWEEVTNSCSDVQDASDCDEVVESVLPSYIKDSKYLLQTFCKWDHAAKVCRANGTVWCLN